jgi:hypothetical protein
LSAVQLVGGPYDGARVSGDGRLPFFWTNGKRCFRKVARGRALYCASQGFFRFVGHTHTVCSCGALRRKSRQCGLCGADSVTSGV